MGAVVRRPVEGEVHVHYGQIYVESDPDSFGLDLAEAFAGQSGGLCGAAIPGGLWLTTGLHTGDVGFTVEVHDQAPPLEAGWEDVVEVSFRPVSADSALVQWAGEDSWDLDLDETDYRVRYSAKGMDEAHRQDTRLDEEPQLDCYLLQFWPAPPAPDRVLEQTSAMAAYWHDYARRLPPPPTPAERAEAERLARLAQERAKQERQLAYERWEWGGRLPSQALRSVDGNVRGLLDFDPDLVHAIDAAGPDVQRAVALLAARHACEAAGLADLDWIAAGLAALAEGRPLPPLFDDPERVWHALDSDPRVPDRTVGHAVPPERPPFQPSARDDADTLMPQIVVPVVAATPPQTGPEPGTPQPTGERYTLMVTVGAPDRSLPVSQPNMALPALLGATEADPLQAALDAVYAAVATYGEEYPALLQEVWSRCQGRP
ncbi:hypothetical protein AQI88_07660 [Streptomyces cellostaticus]|uniref:Uncharacterized protein n=1 Tax=Streptomyces cellostaticus TaxID=67285 RepID=A0A101NQC2_9ACTN|nr:hypothetical protein [Streptomyces cellostaticus]KUM97449.1 hypothetical protein AQI88_07660 [Streptomyces cellostaticus]GHI04079.1 hypothetical protein Scel_24000 [Streptomyces cellostaticus]